MVDNFKLFADAVNAKFMELASSGTLLKTNVSKDLLWETYQSAYPEGTNPIFRERREHDCQTCRSFINRIGSLVGVNSEGYIDTIWNIPNLPYPYDLVASAMHELVYKTPVSGVFLTNEKTAGREFNMEKTEAGEIRWDHFYADINATFQSDNVATGCGEIETTVSVFKRALDEFSISALEQVIDLCDSIYRGTEFQPTVMKFLEAKRAYEESQDQTIFIWTQYKKYPAKIRNSAIGTLIIDINEDTPLEEAVAKYEKVVAPANYKRTTAVVTEGMKKQALVTIEELGLKESLPRRHATLDDISINNVLFSSTSAKAVMKDTIEELLDSTVTKTTEAPKSAQEVSVDEFLANVLPNSKSVQVLLENKHLSNLVSLVAPVNPEAPNMLKWDNNFSWSYAGEVTDSIKERVKAAGGSVTGDLRFSIQWNEAGQDGSNDLDAHCSSPTSHIFYSSRNGRCGGQLDVDITNPSSQTKDGTAVENITWDSLKTMPDGQYKFYVNNYSGRNTNGFRAQVELLGEIFEYSVDKSVTSNITVAVVTLKNGKLSIEHKLPCSSAQKEEWSVTTKEFQEVSTIMLSPNHWNDKAIGNKHFFFMLEDCQNPDPVRGFYNEFLSEDLRPHRKVFEVLSSKMKCTPTKEQLSGLGFSSTQRNELVVKVDSRPYKIKF